MRDVSTLARPNLTDDDLKAIGLITVLWSFAEHQLELLISMLISSPGHIDKTAPHAIHRVRAFNRKIDVFKKLLRITCKDYSEIHEIGKALATFGSILAKRRNKITHWLLSRNIENQPDKIRVGQYSWLFEGDKLKSEEEISAGDLDEIACDISEWFSDLTRFMIILCFSGPLASLAKSDGPGLGVGLLSRESFRTIEKTPQSRPKKS
ncbi:hypothetical protein [Bauldia sp.]|uniref:hypothetical protein n=1 Tax=Bauldia sp. TaxID=2575872 RepID=UPI003BAB73FA